MGKEIKNKKNIFKFSQRNQTVLSRGFYGFSFFFFLWLSIFPSTASRSNKSSVHMPSDRSRLEAPPGHCFIPLAPFHPLFKPTQEPPTRQVFGPCSHTHKVSSHKHKLNQRATPPDMRLPCSQTPPSDQCRSINVNQICDLPTVLPRYSRHTRRSIVHHSLAVPIR